MWLAEIKSPLSCNCRFPQRSKEAYPHRRSQAGGFRGVPGGSNPDVDSTALGHLLPYEHGAPHLLRTLQQLDSTQAAIPDEFGFPAINA